VYAKKRSNRHRRKSCEGRGAELITNGEIHDLTPRFRESAYTPIKKLIGENIPGDFDHMKLCVDLAAKGAIDKRERVIAQVNNNIKNKSIIK